MTVASTTNRVSYSGNGSTVAFAFPHPYRASVDLIVTLRTVSSGAESLQVEGTNYSVSGTPTSDAGGFASGTVTFTVAPAAGVQVHIDRVVTPTQTTDYVAGDGIPPSSIEGSLDKLTQIVQELDSRFERTLLQPRTAANRGLVLPEPKVADAQKVLSVNTGGTGYQLVAPGGVADGDKGDIIVSGSGATWTIDAGAVTSTAIADSSITSAKIADGAIVNADINASAGIDYSKLATMTAGRVLLGNASNAPTVTAVSGDVSIDSSGVTAIAAGVIVDADVNASAAIAYSKLANMTGGSVLLGNASNVPTVTALSGDVTVSNTGVTAIAAGVIVNADVNASAAIAHSKLANITAGQVLLGNASNVPTATALSGDVTVNSSGVTAIGAGVIVDADVNASAAIGNTKLATMAANTIKGVTTSGTPTDLTADNAITVLNTASTSTINFARLAGVQASDAELTAIAGLTSAADRLPYFTGSGTAALATFTAAGRGLVDDATTLAQQETLGAFDTVAAVNAATIDSSVNHIRTAGYYAAGDGGGALYKRISTPSPVKAWHITSSGGVYWELSEAQPNVLMLGAKGDGTTDDSAAFQSAIDYAQEKGRNIVYIPGGKASDQYKIKNINIPGGLTVSGYGAYVKDTGLTGVNHIFKLTGYSSGLLGVYISSASNVSASHAAVVCENTFYVTLKDLRILNAVNGVKLTAATQSSEGTIDNVIVNTFSGKAFWFGPNVNQIRVSNCWADSGQTQVSAGPPATYRPKSGTTGFLMDASGSTTAYGGHLFTNCGTLNCATGWDLAYAALTSYTNCIADNHSGAGVRVGQAGACNNLIFDSMFIGVCGAGIDVKNANTNGITFNGLVTNSIGEIPPGGASTFYTHDALYSSPFYDVIQNSTSFCTINVDSWRAAGANAYRISEATSGNIQTLGGFVIPINSQGTVAGGSTVYLSSFGQAANENDVEVQWPSALYGALVPARVVLATVNAPGAGETYTYTVRFSGNDQMTAATSGASSYGPVFTGNPVTISPSQSVTVKLVTSASAIATRHRGYIQIFAKPS